jgi:threonine dehydratase
MTLDITAIRAAAARLSGQIERTPCRYSRTLSKITGAEVWVKFENLQFTAAYKERGALNKLLQLTEAERKRGVIAASAGNHSQGLAYHAARLGIPVTIVMPRSTPFVKVQQTRNFGAEVVLDGDGYDEASAFAGRLCEERDLVFVHPFNDIDVMAGQGTVAMEMLEDVPDLEVLPIPIGGGGLISGMATAAKHVKPDIRIVGLEPAMYPSFTARMRGVNAGASSGGATIAEGIAVKQPGALTTAICKELVEDIFVAGEDEIEHALAMILEIEKTLIEGAAAAGFAALLANAARFKDRQVGIVMSGGNIDMRLLSNVILRELTREGRIILLVLQIEDRPGQLADIARIIADAGGNVLEVSHNRMMAGIPAKSATLELVVEARDREHAQEIHDRLAAQGFRQA